MRVASDAVVVDLPPKGTRLKWASHDPPIIKLSGTYNNKLIMWSKENMLLIVLQKEFKDFL